MTEGGAAAADTVAVVDYEGIGRELVRQRANDGEPIDPVARPGQRRPRQTFMEE